MLHPGHVQFVLSGDLAAAQGAMRSALEQEGFAVSEESPLEWKAQHGGLGHALLLDALGATARQPEMFTVDFADRGGTVEVKLHRPWIPPAAGIRGPLESARLEQSYITKEAEMRDRLRATGILVSSSN